MVGLSPNPLYGPLRRCWTPWSVRTDLIACCRRADRSFFFETNRRRFEHRAWIRFQTRVLSDGFLIGPTMIASVSPLSAWQGSCLGCPVMALEAKLTDFTRPRLRSSLAFPKLRSAYCCCGHPVPGPNGSMSLGLSMGRPCRRGGTVPGRRRDDAVVSPFVSRLEHIGCRPRDTRSSAAFPVIRRFRGFKGAGLPPSSPPPSCRVAPPRVVLLLAVFRSVHQCVGATRLGCGRHGLAPHDGALGPLPASRTYLLIQGNRI